jgi:hypothetical protein
MSKRKITGENETAKKRRLEDLNSSDSETSSRPSREPYIYEPLDHATDSIRLIELYPDPPDTLVRCTMRQVRLSEAQYTCLSYTWQPSHPQHLIEVNGRSLSIGENLHNFLLAHRNYQRLEPTQTDEVKCHALWVDALCIQQSNTLEKNHQVRQMGKVYENAVSVLVWLGVLSQETKRVLAEALRFAAYFREREELHPNFRSSPLTEHIDFKELVQNHPDPTYASRTRDQKLCLDTNPYWERIWIAQEILLPSAFKVFIFDGISKHSLSVLGSYFGEVLRGDEEEKKIEEKDGMDGSRYFIFMLVKAIGWGESTTKPSLINLLAEFGRCRCQDDRDRIFALLALASPDIDVEVDYNIEPAELFRVVLGQHLRNTPIDHLLHFGALLINALRLQNLSNEPGSTRDGTPSRALIRQPPTGYISSLTWAKSRLFIQKGLNDALRAAPCHEHSMDCIFVGVFDAGNVHVFEYAIESDDEYFPVKYARAYEYLRGQPQLREVAASAVGTERYGWLNKPSEDVYYLSNFEAMEKVNRTYLREWVSPNIELVTGTVEHLSPVHQVGIVQHQMTPARRRYRKVLPWSEFHRSIVPHLFLASIGSLIVTIPDDDRDLKDLPNPRASRPCTCRETYEDDEDGQPNWVNPLRTTEFIEVVAVDESETLDL